MLDMLNEMLFLKGYKKNIEKEKIEKEKEKQ